jgi:hypothetical protein
VLSVNLLLAGSRLKSSGSFFHAAQTNARGARTNMLVYAINDCPHTPQIRVPAPPPRIVRVAHHVTVLRPFAAVFTLQSHVLPCFFRKFKRYESL